MTDPVSWIEENFFLPSRTHPETGEALGSGPIILAPVYRSVLRAALSRNSRGRLAYQTIVWSAPKKTGKTTIAAAVALWTAVCYPNSEIILLANDGAQAHDRAFAAIRSSIQLHDPLPPTRILADRILLPNGSVIRPYPCDAEGIAGANPRLSVITEAWAYTTRQKLRLWAETTPPPNLLDAFRFVESYAGIRGTNSVLEQLWDTAREGYLLEPISSQHDTTVMVNPNASLFYFYDHGTPATRRLPWQTPEYYSVQSRVLPPDEFNRLHLNEWTSSTSAALSDTWLYGCVTDTLPPSDLPIVIGTDAGIVRSNFAFVAVTTADQNGVHHVVDAVRWEPRGAPIDFSAIQQFIISFCASRPVVEIAYDPYQLHQMMTDLQRSHIAFTRPFPQQLRGVADGTLISLLQRKRIAIHRSLVGRIADHYAHTAYDPRSRRFTALRGPNDLIVALSMAVYRAYYYSQTFVLEGEWSAAHP